LRPDLVEGRIADGTSLENVTADTEVH